MHRPERLGGARAHIGTHPEARPPPRILLALLTPLFPAQAQFFCMSARVVDADEMLYPGANVFLLSPMPAAVVHAAQAALPPRLDVQRPVRAVCLFPRTSISRSEIFQCAKNPDVMRSRAGVQPPDAYTRPHDGEIREAPPEGAKPLMAFALVDKPLEKYHMTTQTSTQANGDAAITVKGERRLQPKAYSYVRFSTP
jgi:hypothetical protein